MGRAGWRSFDLDYARLPLPPRTPRYYQAVIVARARKKRIIILARTSCFRRDAFRSAHYATCAAAGYDERRPPTPGALSKRTLSIYICIYAREESVLRGVAKLPRAARALGIKFL